MILHSLMSNVTGKYKIGKLLPVINVITCNIVIYWVRPEIYHGYIFGIIFSFSILHTDTIDNIKLKT